MSSRKTIAEMADEIAEEANKCCNRSDEFEEAIRALALKYLIQITAEKNRAKRALAILVDTL